MARLEQKAAVAFGRDLLHFTNRTNAYRPAGAAYAVARQAVLTG